MIFKYQGSPISLANSGVGGPEIEIIFHLVLKHSTIFQVFFDPGCLQQHHNL